MIMIAPFHHIELTALLSWWIVQLRFRLCCGLLTEDKRHCNINPLATKIQAGRLEHIKTVRVC